MTKKEVSPMYNLIEKLCKENGTSPTKLCTEITGSRGNLPTWQKGNINPVSLVKIADYFHVSTDYLLGRSTESQPDTGHSNENESIQIDTNSDSLKKEFLKAFDNLSFHEKCRTTTLSTTLVPKT